MTKHLFLILLTSFLLLATDCTDRPSNVMETTEQAPLYPDYTDVTIPCNIAPLNFLLRGAFDGILAVAKCGDEQIETLSSDNEVEWDFSEWKTFMKKCADKDVTVTISARSDGQWKAYKPFKWSVVSDSIDSHLTYRLIEPDYEVWNNITLRERDVESFDEKVISDFNLVDNRCMNCHIYANRDPRLSMMYVRGENGGALLNRDGRLTKLNIKTEDMVTGSVYYAFSPDGRYITFSTNVIVPAFHSMPKKRLEVFDSKSDVYVADLATNTILRSPLLNDSTMLETFPIFSHDGKYIYFCSAKADALKRNLKELQYALIRIPFNPENGTIGEQTDTIFPTPSQRTQGTKTSVCHPKISPDGRYLLFTVAFDGTFPIWHPEADQCMMDLQTGELTDLSVVNSEKSDTYHSWSSNSRWFVFASKRDDGLYGKPYLCYIDRHGHAHKPFVLPQEEPTFYDNCLKSFNVPELGRGPLPFNAMDVSRSMSQEAIPFK